MITVPLPPELAEVLAKSRSNNEDVLIRAAIAKHLGRKWISSEEIYGLSDRVKMVILGKARTLYMDGIRILELDDEIRISAHGKDLSPHIQPIHGTIPASTSPGGAAVPHKHTVEIKAWADGAKIQLRYPSGDTWGDDPNPLWLDRNEYRVKPVARMYRVWAQTGGHGVGTVENDAQALAAAKREWFSHWLTGWVEYTEDGS